MRFIPVFLILSMFLFSGAVSAQDDTDNTPSLDEYNNVPSGMVLPENNASPPVAVETTPAPEEGEVMTMEDINAAYRQGQFDLVAKHIIPLANNGYPPAESLLGIMYRSGQGVPKDPAKALTWLTKAATANQPLAQHHLAVMTFTGDGIAEDPVKALMWLHIAIVHYPEGADKKRAIEDRKNISARLSRRDRDRALELARDWLEKSDEGMLLDRQQEQP